MPTGSALIDKKIQKHTNMINSPENNTTTRNFLKVSEFFPVNYPQIFRGFCKNVINTAIFLMVGSCSVFCGLRVDT